MKSENIKPDEVESGYQPKSDVFPSLNLCPSVATFVEHVIVKIKNLNFNRTMDNLEPRLKALSINQDLIIKLAEKGGNTAVMERGQ